MKKLTALLLALVLWLVLAVPAQADSSCTVRLDRYSQYQGGMCQLTLSWTAAANGSFTSYTISDAQMLKYLKGLAYQAETNPGSTAPTAAYDITITNAGGNDIMGGALADRSATATERAAPVLASGTEYPAAINGPLTLNITNNSVNAATGTVVLYWWYY